MDERWPLFPENGLCSGFPAFLRPAFGEKPSLGIAPGLLAAVGYDFTVSGQTALVGAFLRFAAVVFIAAFGILIGFVFISFINFTCGHRIRLVFRVLDSRRNP